MGNAVKPLKNAAGYVVNTAIDVAKNPDVHEGIKKVGRAAGKGLGAAQATVQTIGKDMMAYGQAKAIMNGTIDYTEEPVLDKNGNVVGYKRNIKQNGNNKGKDKNTFGLKPPIQHQENKPGLATHKGTIVRNKGKLEARKGNLGKRQKSMWGSGEEKAGPVNNTLLKPGIGHHRRSNAAITNNGKNGPTNHRRSGVKLVNKDKPGIGNHKRSGVKLVKSELPMLETYNDAEPNMFVEPDFEGFDKKSFKGFYKKSFNGFVKKDFAGFEKKDQFHPINQPRSRAPFESSVNTQRSMLGDKKEKSNVWK